MPFCALMRTGHKLAAQKRLFINNCQYFPIVLAQEQLAARALVDATLTASSLSMQPVLVTNMFEVMKRYVRLTDAISFHFQLSAIAGETLDGLVAVRLADRQLAEARLILGVRRSRALPPSAAAMCERLHTLLHAAVP